MDDEFSPNKIEAEVASETAEEEMVDDEANSE
jgi:hypothetical protein